MLARHRLLIAIFVCLSAVLLIARLPGFVLGFDSLIYHGAARALAEGANPYADALWVPMWGRFALFGGPQYGGTPYLYPPPLAVLLVPLTALPGNAALWTWLGLVVLSCAALAAALRPLVGWRVAALAVVLFAPVWETIYHGQVNALVGLAVAVAIVGAGAGQVRRPAAALTMGALLKITPGLGLAVFALYAPRRTLTTVAAVIGFAVLATLPVVGVEGWVTGLTVATAAERDPVAFVALGPYLAELPGLAGRVGPLGLAVALVLPVLLRRRLARADALAAISLVPMIAAPIVWPHHLVAALPALAVLWTRGGHARSIAVAAWVSAALSVGALILPLAWLGLVLPGLVPNQSAHDAGQAPQHAPARLDGVGGLLRRRRGAAIVGCEAVEVGLGGRGHLGEAPECCDLDGGERRLDHQGVGDAGGGAEDLGEGRLLGGGEVREELQGGRSGLQAGAVDDAGGGAEMQA